MRHIHGIARPCAGTKRSRRSSRRRRKSSRTSSASRSNSPRTVLASSRSVGPMAIAIAPMARESPREAFSTRSSNSSRIGSSVVALVDWISNTCFLRAAVDFMMVLRVQWSLVSFGFVVGRRCSPPELPRTMRGSREGSGLLRLTASALRHVRRRRRRHRGCRWRRRAACVGAGGSGAGAGAAGVAVGAACGGAGETGVGAGAAGGVGVGRRSEGAVVAGAVGVTVPLMAAFCFDPMV